MTDGPTPDPKEPEVVQVPLVWVGADEIPIQMANQFVGQIDGDDVIVSIGQVAPPMMLGTPEENRLQAERLGFVPVRSIARISMNPARLREFIGVLQATAENYANRPKGEAQ